MRRVYHLTAGLFVVLIVAHLDRNQGLVLISSLFLLTLLIETSRLLLPDMNRLFLRYLGLLLRENEKRRPTGTGFYLGGVFLSLLLFEREVALFSMTILAVGDPVASTVGKRWGSHRLGEKSLEGSIAFLVASAGAGFLLYRLWPELHAGLIIAGAAAGTFAELLSRKIDDNLLIPLAAAGAMEGCLFLLNLVYLN